MKSWTRNGLILFFAASFSVIAYLTIHQADAAPTIYLIQALLCVTVMTAVGYEVGYLFAFLATIAGAGTVIAVAGKDVTAWILGEMVFVWLIVALGALFAGRNAKAGRDHGVAMDKIVRTLAELYRESASYKSRIASVRTQADIRTKLAAGVAAIGRSLNPAEIQQDLKKAVQQTFPGLAVDVVWFNPSGDQGLDPFELWLRDHNRFLLVNDARKDERFKIYFDRGFSYEYGSLIMVPMREGQAGGRLGALKVLSKERLVFGQEQARILDLYALLVGLAFENASLHQKVEELAIHDTLTGLYTRKMFDERLIQECAQASRYNLFVSLTIVDIDHFKSFNDNYGHQVGDALLVWITRLLKNSVRDVDFVARYGGEEFVIIFPETPKDQASQVMENIRRSVEARGFSPDGSLRLGVSLSAGIASFPDETTSPHQLLRAADERLYMAKGSGRNRVVSY
ncbi:MAG: GGDEF domain-containing protein [Elusimicrobia bacterium]|nr:GGDEF domain-containing protein [Elusimicrobiota bacterium]